MKYKEGLIENIYLLIVYTDIFMHGYGYILGHSDHSAFTAQVLLAVLRVNEHLSVFLDMVNIKHNIEL